MGEGEGVALAATDMAGRFQAGKSAVTLCAFGDSSQAALTTVTAMVLTGWSKSGHRWH